MGQIKKQYRLRIANHGATDVTGNVAWQFTSTIGKEPVVGGQIIRPTEARAESKTWEIEVVDSGDVFTATLSDPATNRAWLIGRLTDIQVSTDGGSTYTTLATGRLADIFESEVGVFTVHVADERWVERNTEVFKGVNSTTIYPSGSTGVWRGFFLSSTPIVSANFTDVEQVATSGSFVRVMFYDSKGNYGHLSAIAQADLIDKPVPQNTAGNFKFLKLSIAGTDYPIVTFNESLTEPDCVRALEAADDHALRVWIYAPTGIGSPTHMGKYYFGYIHAPTKDPSDDLPLHTGTTLNGTTPYSDADAMGLVKQIYDQLGIRYDVNVFSAYNAISNPQGLIAHPLIPPMTFRITRPERLSTWLDENIYTPLMIAPFINSAGRIAPKLVSLPHNLNIGSLFTFNETNLAEQPTFDYTSGDMVNSIEFHVPVYKYGRWDADMIAMTEKVWTITHDNASNVKLDPMQINLNGLQSAEFNPLEGVTGSLPELNLGNVTSLAESYAELIAHEIFERFGDGSITGRFFALSAASSVEPGDFVILDLSSYPDLKTRTRGGSARIVQIMSKTTHIDGYEFEYLDAGEQLNALATPTVTVAQTAGNTKHSVDITVSGLPAGTTAEVQISRGNGTSPVLWETVKSGVANGTYTIPSLPSNTKIWARARSTAVARIRSDWSTNASVVTAAISAPTGLSATVLNTNLALSWTVGDANYPVMVRVGLAANSVADALLTPLAPQSAAFMLSELTASTNYYVEIVHIDAFGGKSAALAGGPYTMGTKATLTAPQNLQITQGRSATTDVLPPQNAIIGYGLQVQWRSVDMSSRTIIEVSTASNFGTIEASFPVAAGVQKAFLRLNDKLDNVTRYVRCRSIRDGFNDSANSSTVSALLTALTKFSYDGLLFPGGWAFLSINGTNGKAEINIGTDDPDVDRAYYATSTNGSPPTVDTSSSFIAAASLPTIIATNSSPIGLWLKVRFWNALSGFGQEVQHRLTAQEAGVPTCTVVPTAITATNATYLITGSSDADQYCYREYDENATPGAYSAWTTFNPSTGASVNVTRSTYVSRIIEVLTRNSTTAVTSTVFRVTLDPSLLAGDAQTGRAGVGLSPTNWINDGGAQQTAIGSVPSAWTRTTGTNNMVAANDWFKYGDRSFKISHPVASRTVYRQQFAVTAGQVLCAGMWIKTNNLSGAGSVYLNIDHPQGSGAIELFDSIGSVAGVIDVGTAALNAEVYVETRFRVLQSDTIDFNLDFGYTSTLSGDVWFDGITLSEVTPKINRGGKRAYDGLDDSGKLTTEVLPTAKVAGTGAHLVARQGHGVFYETFESDISNTWNRLNGTGSGTSLQSGAGIAGGSEFQVTSYHQYEFPQNIPYDPSKLYRMRVRFRKVGAGAGAQRDAYVGLRTYGADGVTALSDWWVIGIAQTSLTLNQFYEYTAYFKGSGTEVLYTSDPTNPSPLNASARYFRPEFIFNYNLGTDTMRIDEIAIDVLEEGAVDRAYTALDASGDLQTNVRSDATVAGTNANTVATGGSRGYNALDGTNELITAVKSSAKIAEQQALSVAKRAGIFFSETFDALPSNWGGSQPTGGGSLVSTVGVAKAGKNVWQGNGHCFIVFPYDLPFNPTKQYRLRARFRYTSGASTYNTYIGLQCLLSDGTLANTNGGYDYVVRNGDGNTVADGWQEITAWVKGATLANNTSSSGYSIDPTAAQPLHLNTVNVRPLICMNYNSLPGAVDWQVDYFQIEELDEDNSDLVYNTIVGVEQLSNATGQQNKSLFKGYLEGTAKDGDTVTFPVGFFTNTPAIHLELARCILHQPVAAQWSPDGVFNTGVAEEIDLAIVSPSNTGFTVRARLQQDRGTTLSAQNQEWPDASTASGQSTSVNDYIVSPALSAIAYDNNYVIRYSGEFLLPAWTPGKATRIGSITVRLESSANGTFTDAQTVATNTHNGSNPDTQSPVTISFSNQSFSVTVTGLTASTSKFRLSISVISGEAYSPVVRGYDYNTSSADGDLTTHGISYSTQTGQAPRTTTMTPSTPLGAYYIRYKAYDKDVSA